MAQVTVCSVARPMLNVCAASSPYLYQFEILAGAYVWMPDNSKVMAALLMIMHRLVCQPQLQRGLPEIACILPEIFFGLQ